ncbi:MAG: curlin repeat-containing protein [Phaeodactylibacter sp.]|nr:curlin repeat-containing protein [Phaeodactylibacter sp.]MCB9300451.1 curlin repeat-containing protein [Lewinellaceae bacterium]HQU59910.1 hypothetical protein [Saprospiraceae bacterium]
MRTLIFALLCFLAGPAFGQNDIPAPNDLFDRGLNFNELGLSSNRLGVLQQGDNNTIDVQQRQPEMQHVELQQIGDYNHLEFTVRGQNNDVAIQQNGSFNQASLGEVDGIDNRFIVSQQGNGNVYTRESAFGTDGYPVDGVNMVVGQRGDGNQLLQLEDGLTPATTNPIIIEQTGGANIQIQFSNFLSGRDGQ